MSYELLRDINIFRANRLAQSAIQKFSLSLRGLNIFTEAASGYFMFTSIIAALAGAQKVYALAKDSRHGKAADICDATMFLARHLKIEDRIEILFSRDASEIGSADIVTNLGHVRPIDKILLGRFKKTVVIPLMFEAWEFRPEDLDLSECRRIGIPVLATNEDHPLLETFKYLGNLALKLLFELDVEVIGSHVLVLGSGKFGTPIVESLRKAGARVSHLVTERPEVLASIKARDALSNCDGLVVAEHVSRAQLIGPDGPITGRDLAKLNSGLVIAHIAGNVDQRDIERFGIQYRPKRLAGPGYMSVATDYLGPRPVIDLHTAGLKIGEIMARARIEGQDRVGAERAGLGLGFSHSVY